MLDLVSQQHKLFIAIASSHVFRVTGAWMWDMHSKALRSVEQGNMDLLPEASLFPSPGEETTPLKRFIVQGKVEGTGYAEDRP